MAVPRDTRREAEERLALKKVMDVGEYKVPKRELDENLVVATWNIQHFGARHPWRAIKYIADIVERFDIVALQELKADLTGLARLQEILPGDYRVILSDATGNSERFAFIYDRRTVVPTGLVAEIVLPLDTKTHQGFQIHRTPYCASFRAGRFDFTIVSVHIFQTDTKIREKEIQLLADQIRELSKKEQTKVVDRDFFVMGDFNIDKAGDKFFKALKKEGFKMPPGMDALTTNFGRSKTFDKIAWVPRPDFHFGGHMNVVPFYKAVYQARGEKKGEKEISDHLPLWAEFRIDEFQQQLDQVINPN